MAPPVISARSAKLWMISFTLYFSTANVGGWRAQGYQEQEEYDSAFVDSMYIDMSLTGDYLNEVDTSKPRASCDVLMDSVGCKTIWEWLTCRQGFNVTTEVARHPGVQLDEILADPSTSVTFFAATDDFYKSKGVNPGARDSTPGVYNNDMEPLYALFTFLYMTLPGSWNTTDLQAVTTVTTASFKTWQLFLSNNNAMDDGVLALNFESQSDGKIYVHEAKKYKEGSQLNSEVVEVLPACNGMLYIVSEYWSRAVLTDGQPPAGYKQPLNRNKALIYQPECDMTVQELVEVCWLNSNDTAWQLSLVDLMNQTLESASAVRGLDEMSFTWLLPKDFLPPPLPADATEDEIALQMSWLLYHLLPGAWCPQDLVSRGEVETMLGWVTNTSAPLTFTVEDVNGEQQHSDELPVQISVVDKEGNALGKLERPYTTCRTVVYGLRHGLAGAFNSSDMVHNSQLLQLGNLSVIPALQVPHVVDMGQLPSTNLSDVWDIVYNWTQHLKNNPGLCAQELPRKSDLAAIDQTLPAPDPNQEAVWRHDAGNQAAAGGSVQVTLIIVLCLVLAVILLAVLVGAALVVRRQRIRLLQDSRLSDDTAMTDANALEKMDDDRLSSSGDVELVVKSTEVLCTHSEETPFSIDTIAAGKSSPRLAQVSLNARAASLGPSPAPSLASSASLRQVLDAVEHNWVIPSTQLKFFRKVGSGSFGQVYSGQWNSTVVAIKRLPEEMHQSEGELKKFLDSIKALQKEVSIMAGLRHPNVVLLLGVCLEPPAVVTEYCERGSLYNVIQGVALNPKQLTQFDWRRRLQVALEAATGMEFLHSRSPPVLHCDLKSPNLLVDRAWHVKVADFGLSRLLVDTAMSRSSLVVMNPKWLAPEVIRNCSRSTAADVFSFGIIMWELLMLAEPFVDMQPIQIAFAVVNNRLRPALPQDLNQLAGGSFAGVEDYVQLMTSCWSHEPQDRPSFKEVVEQLRQLKRTAFQGPPSLPPPPSQSPGPHPDAT